MKRTITKTIIAVLLVTLLLTGCKDKSGGGKKAQVPDQGQTAVTETADAEKEDAEKEDAKDSAPQTAAVPVNPENLPTRIWYVADNGNLINEEHIVYTADGRPVLKVMYSPGMSGYNPECCYIYHYLEDGSVQKDEYDGDGTFRETVVLEEDYPVDGSLWAVINTVNSSADMKIRYKDGLPVSTEGVQIDGYGSAKLIYEDGRIVGKECGGYRVEYAYDDQDRLSSSVVYASDNSVYMEEKCEYDGKDRIVSKKITGRGTLGGGCFYFEYETEPEISISWLDLEELREGKPVKRAAESDITPPEFEIPVTGQKWENEDLAVWLTPDGILHMESVNQEPLLVSFAGASRNGIAVDTDDLNWYLHRLDDSSGFREEIETELIARNSSNWWPCGVYPYEYTVRLQVTKNPESETPEEYETENISLLKPAQWTAKGSGEVIGEEDGLRLEFIGIVPGDYRSDIFVGATNTTDHIVSLNTGNADIAVIPGAQALINAGSIGQKDGPGVSREFHYNVRDAGMDDYEPRTIAYSLPGTIGDTEIGGIAGELLEIIHSEADVYGAYRYEDGTIRKMAALVRTEEFVREMVEHNGVWTSPGEIFSVSFDSRGIWWKDTLFYYKAENKGMNNIIAECGVSGSGASEEMDTRYITSEDLNHSEEAPDADPDEPADVSRDSDESRGEGTGEAAAEANQTPPAEASSGKEGESSQMQAVELIQDFLDRIHNDEIYLTDGFTASEYSYIIGTGANPIYEITDVNHDGSPELFISIVNRPDYSVMYYVKDGEVVEAKNYIIFGHSGDGEILASDRWDQWCGHLSWDGQDWVEGSDSTYEELMEECVTFSNMTAL